MLIKLIILCIPLITLASVPVTVVVSNQTLQVEGTVHNTGTTQVEGQVSITNTVPVTGSVAVTNTVPVTGSLAVTNTVTVTGSVQATLTAPIEVSNDLYVYDSMSFPGIITSAGSVKEASYCKLFTGTKEMWVAANIMRATTPSNTPYVICAGYKSVQALPTHCNDVSGMRYIEYTVLNTQNPASSIRLPRLRTNMNAFFCIQTQSGIALETIEFHHATMT